MVFSPCFEQVQLVSSELRALDYSGELFSTLFWKDPSSEIEAYEVICKPISVWGAVDAQRKAERILNSQLKNLEKAENNTSRQNLPKKEPKGECSFQYVPYTISHLQMRGHTGYIITAKKGIPS